MYSFMTWVTDESQSMTKQRSGKHRRRRQADLSVSASRAQPSSLWESFTTNSLKRKGVHADPAWT
jgi:hypothetical protein